MEEHQLIVAAQAGDMEARNEVLRRVRPGIRRIVALEWRPGADLDDMEQMALLEVNRSLSRIDVSRGVPLLSYCFRSIRRAAYREARSRSWMRLSALGPGAVASEAPRVSVSAWEDLDRLWSPSHADLEARELVGSALGMIDSRSADILSLYFGLHPDGPLSMPAIAMRLGIPRTTLNKIRDRALNQIREILCEIPR